jgi:hypothetical protein
MALPDGLYVLLLTEGLTRSLAALDPISADVLALKGGAAEFLADVITRQLAIILDDVSGDDADKAKRQLELVNELLVMLRQRLNASGDSNGASASAEVVDLVASPLRVLRAVQRDQHSTRANLCEGRQRSTLWRLDAAKQPEHFREKPRAARPRAQG